jgi:DNA-binding winged helix-turn-helix (wHTH) protein/TolB-like protein/tetratricopeptide (TPR) repeat protein
MSFREPKKDFKSVISTGTGGHIVYSFGPFKVDRLERRLYRDGQTVAVTAKAFDTLLFLVERSNHLIEKADLMAVIWPDSFVEEGNLSVTIHMLRKILGDDSIDHKYIETVPKRGYRFIACVREVVEPEAHSPAIEELQPVAPEPATPSRRSTLLAAIFTPIRVAILTVLALAVVSAAVQMRKPSEAVPKIRSLAILPFQILNSADTPKNQDYLGLGMADAIITKMGNTGRILVRPTSAVSKYANALTDPLAAGREQGVDAILSGNIQVRTDRVIVTAQLVRVSNGALLWADTFEETPERMFALETAVEERVARSMFVRISEEAAGSPSKHSSDFKAYQLYLQGRYFWNKRTEDGLRRSIEYFQQATLEDPQYSTAYAGLADAYTLLGSYGVEPAEQAYPNARSAALKALELDDSLSEAHTSLGMISFYYEWNWPGAEREFRRSIELNPNYPMVRAWYAINLAALGRNDEALQQVRRSQELDPVSLIINTEVGRVYYLTRKYDEAAAAFRKVIELDPEFARAHTRLGMTYAAEMKFAEAIVEFQLAQRLSGPDPYLDGLLGYSYARSGNNAAAKRLLNELKQRSRREYVPAFSMALIYIGLGEKDPAFDLLNKSYSDRSTYLVYAKADPLLDTVRADPRFKALLERMRLS